MADQADIRQLDHRPQSLHMRGTPILPPELPDLNHPDAGAPVPAACLAYNKP